jgi:hypothetical protein
MKKTNDITKIVGSKSLLSQTQAGKVLEYLKDGDDKYLDMKNVDGCTNAFVHKLVYEHNKSTKFERSSKLIFFNVKNPILALKIQEAQFIFFDKKKSKSYIKMHDKIMKEILNDY